ncbi:TIGR00725 family protein [Halobacteriales archaeon QS_3_64_16]|nr:MAG: TIGR00725 family protein [Halobacteriales archaeon QS_3_64_16]
MRVSVIGGGTVGAGEKHYEQAKQVGELLAERDHTVVCGGRGGVMEAVCKGASEAGGRSIGILPGADRSAANPFVTMAIATGLGNARNALVVLNGDGAIAIDGATGTLSEISHALDFGRPVAGLDTHEIRGVEALETPAEAVSYVEAHA